MENDSHDRGEELGNKYRLSLKAYRLIIDRAELQQCTVARMQLALRSHQPPVSRASGQPSRRGMRIESVVYHSSCSISCRQRK